MDHNFNTQIAKTYGVHEAIFIHNLYYWIFKNTAHGRHFYDGRSWTYYSLTALEKIFIYFSRRQIRTLIDNCVNKGAVIKGNFNKAGYDKTSWFSLSDDVMSFYQRYDQIDTANYDRNDTTYVNFDTTYDQNDTTIPNNKPNNKLKEIYKEKKFEIPSVEEIKTYCIERKNNVNPQKFFDFYQSKGWLVGKVKMKDWKAAVRTWESRNEKPKKETSYNLDENFKNSMAIVYGDEDDS